MKKRKIQLNLSLLGGSIFGIAVILLSALNSTSNPLVFLNVVGFGIVAGGITSAALIILPLRELAKICSLISRSITYPPPDDVQTAAEIIRIAELQQFDPYALAKLIETVENETLRDAMVLATMNLNFEELKKQLTARGEMREAIHLGYCGFLMTLAKLGPAFGLLGTLVGLVVLLQDLGGSGNFDRVGGAMSISLLATLYGVLAANMLLQPLAEYLRFASERLTVHECLVTEGMLLVKEKRHPIQIRESLKAYIRKEHYGRLDVMMAENTAANRSAAHVESAPRKERAAS